MKKFIAVSLIGIMVASAGVVASPVITTGLTELIAEELIVDKNQSLQIKLVYDDPSNPNMYLYDRGGTGGSSNYSGGGSGSGGSLSGSGWHHLNMLY